MGGLVRRTFFLFFPSGFWFFGASLEDATLPKMPEFVQVAFFWMCNLRGQNDFRRTGIEALGNGRARLVITFVRQVSF